MLPYGLQEGASESDIKAAYRKMAFDAHPDRGGNEEEFKRITAAYEYLTGKRQDKARPPPNPFNDIFGGAGGFDFSSFFGGFGGFNPNVKKKKRRPPSKRSEMGMKIETNVEQIINGRNFEIEYQMSQDCNVCKGVGGKRVDKCGRCEGAGFRMNVQRNQQNMMWSSMEPCNDCEQEGRIFPEGRCSNCAGEGYTVIREKLKFKLVKE
jgi:DnaJ-class molecular chaperone